MTPKTGMYLGIGGSVGLLVVVGIIALVIMSHRESIGEPTEATRDPAIFTKIDLELDLSRLISLPSAAGGALADYQAAVKGEGIGDDFIKQVKESMDPQKEPRLKAIVDKLEAGADKVLGEDDLEFDAIIPMTPRNEWPISDELQAMGNLVCKAGLSVRDAKDSAGEERAAACGAYLGRQTLQEG